MELPIQAQSRRAGPRTPISCWREQLNRTLLGPNPGMTQQQLWEKRLMDIYNEIGFISEESNRALGSVESIVFDQNSKKILNKLQTSKQIIVLAPSKTGKTSSMILVKKAWENESRNLSLQITYPYFKQNSLEKLFLEFVQEIASQARTRALELGDATLAEKFSFHKNSKLFKLSQEKKFREATLLISTTWKESNPDASVLLIMDEFSRFVNLEAPHRAQFFETFNEITTLYLVTEEKDSIASLRTKKLLKSASSISLTKENKVSVKTAIKKLTDNTLVVFDDSAIGALTEYSEGYPYRLKKILAYLPRNRSTYGREDVFIAYQSMLQEMKEPFDIPRPLVSGRKVIMNWFEFEKEFRGSFKPSQFVDFTTDGLFRSIDQQKQIVFMESAKQKLLSKNKKIADLVGILTFLPPEEKIITPELIDRAASMYESYINK